MKSWNVLTKDIKVKVDETWATTLAWDLNTPLTQSHFLSLQSRAMCPFLPQYIVISHIGIIFGLGVWCELFSILICIVVPMNLEWLPRVLVKKLIGYQLFFSWIDENHNVISCFILLVKVAKIMLIWLPCVVMKTCHEKGITFNERMTNWGFGTLKWTTATSSTRHLNSFKNFITFAFETMWILINFVSDVTCVTSICW